MCIIPPLCIVYIHVGNTPLHIAAGRRLKEIVALLMAYGANPALANGEGDFPTDLPASLLVSHHHVLYILMYHSFNTVCVMLLFVPPPPYRCREQE